MQIIERRKSSLRASSAYRSPEALDIGNGQGDSQACSEEKSQGNADCRIPRLRRVCDRTNMILIGQCWGSGKGLVENVMCDCKADRTQKRGNDQDRRMPMYLPI
jgi:hypothetical protein